MGVFFGVFGQLFKVFLDHKVFSPNLRHILSGKGILRNTPGGFCPFLVIFTLSRGQI